MAHNASVLAAEAADPLSETHYLSTPIEETFSYGRLPYPGCAFLRTHPNRFATLSRNATSRLPVEDALDRACPQSIMVASWWVLGIFGSFQTSSLGLMLRASLAERAKGRHSSERTRSSAVSSKGRAWSPIRKKRRHECAGQ